MRISQLRRRVVKIAVVLGGVCWLSACGHPSTEEVQTDTVVPVTTEPATLGTIRAVIHATGTVAPAPGADLLVIAPEPARIADIPKAEGDRVQHGEVLVRFEIPTLTADAAAKRAEVARAEARLENAKAAQARAHDLFDRGVAARKEVEDADRERTDAEAALVEAQAARTAADAVAGRTTVRATFDGVIAKRFHNPGDQVEAASSDPVLRVIDPRRLEVNAMVPIAGVHRILVGAQAHLVEASGQPRGALKVVSRPAAVEQGTAAVPVRLAFAAPRNYPAGAPVQVAIDAEEHTNVVLVPASAVMHEGEETFVFVSDGTKAHRRPIVIGLADPMRVEVQSGLKAGEAVITSGQTGLPDDAAISVTPAK